MTERLYSQPALATEVMSRMAVKDFTFSNGIVIPTGTTISVALLSTHIDEANYSNPESFDPGRFARMREGGSDDAKLHFVSPGADYLSFGSGKHAWYVTESLRACFSAHVHGSAVLDVSLRLLQ